MDSKSKLNKSAINKIIKEYSLASTADIVSFLIANKDAYSFYDLSKIAEHANQLRTENSAYYTDEELLLSISENLLILMIKNHYPSLNHQLESEIFFLLFSKNISIRS